MHRNIKLLTWFNFALDFRPYAPVAIIYFALITGSYFQGMGIFAMSTIATSLCEVPTGILSDRVGRKWTIILGCLASITGVVFFAASNGFLMLAMGGVFNGLAEAFFSGNNNAFLYDTLKSTSLEQEYHEYLGRTNSMFQLALGISALLGGIMAQWSFKWLMWISVIPQVACLFISLQFSETTSPGEKQEENFLQYLKKALQQFKTNSKLRKLGLASVLNFSVGEATYQFQSAFFQSLWPLWAIGAAKTISNFGAAFSFHFSGRAIKKWSEYPLLIFSKVASRVLYCLALVFPSVFSPAMISLNSLFFGVSVVADNTLLQHQFTDQQRAVMGSLISLGTSIAFAIFSLALGYIADCTSPVIALLVAQGFLFLPIFLYISLFKHTKPGS